MEKIILYDLSLFSHLSNIRCLDMAESASVCLDYFGFRSGVILSVFGDFQGEFELIWPPTSQQIRDTRNDMDYTVENGAYCLAIHIVERFTGLKVVKQSQKRTGFDYWLGEKLGNGMQNLARLEVSGILRGKPSKIKHRLQEKIEQTKKSDNLSLPAYVVIVEFSHLITKIHIRKSS